jgi:hypothetical protein
VAALFWIAALWQTWRQPSPANRHWVSSGRGAGDGPMTREDALALLDAMCRDPNPPPPIEGEDGGAVRRRHLGRSDGRADLRCTPPGSGGNKMIDRVLSSVVAMAALAFAAAIVIGVV